MPLLLRNSTKTIVLVSMTLVGLFAGFALALSTKPVIAQDRCEVAVLADSGDPYYPLAEEIAHIENATLLQSLQELDECPPEFLLWVFAPKELSDERMIEFGQALQRQPSAISAGLITASTLDGARALWQRLLSET